MEWINAAEQMPESGKRVVFFWKNAQDKGRTSIGWWVDKLQEPAEGDWNDVLEFCDYDAAEDCYFIPEGWYEWGYEPEVSGHVTDTVTHWMPLPKPPSTP